MNYQKHCPGCFRRKDSHPVCPHCGYDEAASRSPLFLPHGTVLAGQYRVGKVLGRPGGFGITYLGWDIYLQQKVAIKEYLPPDIAARIPESQDITVHTADDRKGFESGKEQFLREARIVARLDHPNVVRVRGFFNANDTAYMVMDYYDGMSLDAYFVQMRPTLEPAVASSLMQLVLDGLDYVHRHGVVHRDLKPHNIYLAAVGKPIILDFGAARQAAAGSHKSISVVLTEGYAPLEQYQRHGTQGPWTDVYGVAATLYRMILGRAPPVALDRIHRDVLDMEDFAGLPEPLKPVMRKALALKPEERYQSAAAFKLALAIAMGPASASTPMPSVSAGIANMARQLPSDQPLPQELLRDTTRRSESNSEAETAITRTGPFAEAPPRAASEAPWTVTSRGSALPLSPAEVRANAAMDTLREAPNQRTHTPTAPSAVNRWLLPAVGLIVAAGVAIALWPSSPRPVAASASTVAAAPSPAPAAPPAPVQKPAPALDRFNVAQLPRLSDQAFPEMVDVPAGVRGDAQFPAFSISRTEITVGKFRSFVERTGYTNPKWDNYPCDGTSESSASWQSPGYAQTESHPVVCINWDDARRYAIWLSQETGRQYRLPTDAEWEYAAAAGSNTRFWWGDQINEGNAVCADCGRQNPSRPWIVATLGQNAWGLFGTASNVREWTCSLYPQGGCAAPSETGERITRGGSWHDPTAALRTDFRDTLDKNRRNTWTGFRVIGEASPK